ncbi:MAG: restriction endonuclease subunit S [Rhodocyclales bacterium]|nr:restriction endonuclease subunit S [Rhodocyclales bacterium]
MTMAEVITDNLDLWTSALLTKSTAGRGSNGKLEAYGIKKLRELILELAVRGKLVPQDQSDEPARELLKRVAADKAKMVKEGKIRKEKDFPAITDEEIPFNVPGGWEWARINDVGHDWGQKTPDAKFIYIDVSAIDNTAGVISSPGLLSAADAPSRARKIVTKGTVIYSTVRPYLKNICVIEEDYSPEAIASTAFAVLHPFQDMPGKFFALYFRSPEFVKYVEKVQTGIAYPAINDKQFYGGLVPIPPSAEQHRIVAKVDELMALCDQLERQQTDRLAAHQTLVETLLGTLTRVASQQEFNVAWARIANHFDTLFTTEASIDQLKQTTLQLAVMGKLVPQDPNDVPASVLLKRIQVEKAKLIAEGKIKKDKPLSPVADEDKPITQPPGWEWVRLGEIAETIRGVTYGKSEASDVPQANYVPLLRGNNINQTLNFDNQVFVPKQLLNDAQYVKAGDIVIAMSSGSADLVGKAAQATEDFEGGFGAFCGVIRPVSDELHSYFGFFFQTPLYRNRAAGHGKGIGINNLQKTALQTLEIPLPPLDEQHRIVAKVDELIALCDALKARIQDAQTTQIHLADAIVEQAVC